MPQSCDRRSCECSEFSRDPSSTLILEDSAFKRLPPNLHMISDANELTDGSDHELGETIDSKSTL
tara:strand:+ start:474 stop:668 length:195 start_codon:yes stop_codon:yes gene_type:complete